MRKAQHTCRETRYFMIACWTPPHDSISGEPCCLWEPRGSLQLVRNISGASQECDIELAARFAVEVAQSFGKGRAKFHDSEEFTRLVTLYGPMKHLQRAQGTDKAPQISPDEAEF